MKFKLIILSAFVMAAIATGCTKKEETTTTTTTTTTEAAPAVAPAETAADTAAVDTPDAAPSPEAH